MAQLTHTGVYDRLREDEEEQAEGQWRPVRSLRAGLHGLGASFTSAQAALAHAAGNTEQGDALQQRAAREQARAQGIRGAVPSFSEADSPGDYLTWGTDVVASNLPLLAATAATGGIGGAVGGGLARAGAAQAARSIGGAATNFGARRAAVQALGRKGAARAMRQAGPNASPAALGQAARQQLMARGVSRGATAGAAPVYGATSVGENFSRIGQDPDAEGTPQQQALGALAGGAAQTALGLAPIGKVAGMATSKAPALATGAVGALAEGVTETGEQMVQRATHGLYNEDVNLLDPEARREYLESFAAGTLVGGVMGGVGGLAGQLAHSPRARAAADPGQFQTYADAGEVLSRPLDTTPRGSGLNTNSRVYDQSTGPDPYAELDLGDEADVPLPINEMFSVEDILGETPPKEITFGRDTLEMPVSMEQGTVRFNGNEIPAGPVLQAIANDPENVTSRDLIEAARNSAVNRIAPSRAIIARVNDTGRVETSGLTQVPMRPHPVIDQKRADGTSRYRPVFVELQTNRNARGADGSPLPAKYQYRATLNQGIKTIRERQREAAARKGQEVAYENELVPVARYKTHVLMLPRQERDEIYHRFGIPKDQARTDGNVFGRLGNILFRSGGHDTPVDTRRVRKRFKTEDNDGVIAVMRGLPKPVMQGTLLAETPSDKLLGNKGNMRAPLVMKLGEEGTLVREEEALAEDMLFGKGTPTDGYRGVFTETQNDGPSSAVMSYQGAVSNLTDPAAMIRADTQRIQEQGLESELSDAERALYEAGVAAPLLLHPERVAKGATQFQIQGVRDMAIASSQLRDVNDAVLLRDTYEDFVRQHGRAPKVGETIYIGREPHLPTGTGMVPVKFAGIAKFDGFEKGNRGIVVHPKNPYAKGMGLDFDGDRLVAMSPESIPSDLRINAGTADMGDTTRLVSKTPRPLTDEDVQNADRVGAYEGDDVAALLFRDADGFEDEIGRWISTGISGLEALGNTNPVLAQFRDEVSNVAQASVSSVKKAWDRALTEQMKSNIRGTINALRNRRALKVYGPPPPGKRPPHLPFISEKLRELDRAPASEKESKFRELVDHAELLQERLGEELSDVEQAMIERIKVLEDQFERKRVFAGSRNVGMPDAFVHAARAETERLERAGDPTLPFVEQAGKRVRGLSAAIRQSEESLSKLADPDGNPYDLRMLPEVVELEAEIRHMREQRQRIEQAVRLQTRLGHFAPAAVAHHLGASRVARLLTAEDIQTFYQHGRTTMEVQIRRKDEETQRPQDGIYTVSRDDDAPNRFVLQHLATGEAMPIVPAGRQSTGLPDFLAEASRVELQVDTGRGVNKEGSRTWRVHLRRLEDTDNPQPRDPAPDPVEGLPAGWDQFGEEPPMWGEEGFEGEAEPVPTEEEPPMRGEEGGTAAPPAAEAPAPPDVVADIKARMERIAASHPNAGITREAQAVEQLFAAGQITAREYKDRLDAIERSAETYDSIKKREAASRNTVRAHVEAIAKALGIEPPTVLSLDEALAKTDPAEMDPDGRSRMENLRTGRIRGLSFKDGSIYIASIDDKLAQFTTVGHEIGHQFMNAKWEELQRDDPELAQRIWDDYTVWRDQATQGEPTLADVRNARAGAARQESTEGSTPFADAPEERQAYTLSFREWFADQVARFAEQDVLATNEQEHFFKTIARQMKALYERLRRRFGLDLAVAPSVREFIARAGSPAVEPTTEPAADPDPVGEVEPGAYSDLPPETLVRNWMAAFQAGDIVHFGAVAHDLSEMLRERLSPEDYAALLRAASSASIQHQMATTLQHHREAVEEIRSDSERAAAYLYVLASNKLLKTGPKTQNALNSIKDTLRQEWNAAQDTLEASERERLVVEAFEQGTLDIRTPITELGETSQVGEARRMVLGGLNRLWRSIYKVWAPTMETMHERLVETNVPVLRDLARSVSAQYGDVAGESARGTLMSRLQNQFQKHAQEAARIMEPARGDQELTERVRRAAFLPGVYENESPEVKRIVRQLRGFSRRMHEYMDRAGLAFPARRNYTLPLVWDKEYLREHFDEFFSYAMRHEARWFQAREEAIAAETDEGRAEQLAEMDISEFVRIQLRGLLEDDGVLGPNPTSAHNPGFRYMNHSALRFLVEEAPADTHDQVMQFLDKDIGTALARYVRSATKRAEYARSFGANGERLVMLLNQAREQGATEQQVDMARNYVDMVFGMYGISTRDKLNMLLDTLPLPNTLRERYRSEEGVISRQLQSDFGWVITYQNFRLLTTNFFSGLVDPFGVGVRSGSPAMTVKAFHDAIRSWGKDASQSEVRSAIELLGTTNHLMVAEDLMQTYYNLQMTPTQQRLNDWFFRANQVERLTQVARTIGTAGAIQFLKHHAQLPSKRSRRFLTELGVSPEDIRVEDGWLKLLTPEERHAATDAEQQRDDRVRQAIMRFVDESSIRPNPTSRPGWMNDPHTALVGHLRSFTFSFHNTILKRIEGEVFQHGNMAPALMLVATFVPVMLFADWLRDLLRTGGEGRPDWKKSWEAADHINYAVVRAGLGGKHELMFDVMDSFDRGGVPKALAEALGPTTGQLNNLLTYGPGQRDLPFQDLWREWN
jgi:hypothetical protein